MGKKYFPSNPKLSATRTLMGERVGGVGGGGGMMTQERRTRRLPLPTSHEKDRRSRDFASDFSSSFIDVSMAKYEVEQCHDFKREGEEGRKEGKIKMFTVSFQNLINTFKRQITNITLTPYYRQ